MENNLEDLYEKGIRLFGTKEKFEQWLDRESYGLCYQIPRKLLDLEGGIDAVMNELISIKFETTA